MGFFVLHHLGVPAFQILNQVRVFDGVDSFGEPFAHHIAFKLFEIGFDFLAAIADGPKGIRRQQAGP